MAKTLKLKRIFAYTIYNNLKNTPPKNYPTTGEIKSTVSDILPELRKNIEGYLEIVKPVEELNLKLVSKEMTQDEFDKKLEEINEKWRAYGKDHGMEIVELNLKDEAFNALNAQFNRDGWGRFWAANIEEFSELIDVFAQASK